MRISPFILLLCVGVLGCGSGSAQSNAKLTTCPDWEGKVSKLAAACPHCGRPLSGTQAQPQEVVTTDKQVASSAEKTPAAATNKKQITGQETLTNSIGMKLKLIPAGEFQMGSPADEEDRDVGEHQHAVRVTKPFYLGRTEVTQGQWRAVMGTTPWKDEFLVEEGDTYAATYVSWDDAAEFCERLSKREGKTYRLPTEAEWEYACRGGTTTMYHFGDNASRLGEYAWFYDNAYDVDEQYAHRVGQKKANPFGLHDMHGNVWEWCADTGPSTASDRVFRGGGWNNVARYCRSANRGRSAPSGRYYYLGFRVALVPSSE